MHEPIMLVARWIVIVDDIISASIGQQMHQVTRQWQVFLVMGTSDGWQKKRYHDSRSMSLFGVGCHQLPILVIDNRQKMILFAIQRIGAKTCGLYSFVSLFHAFIVIFDSCDEARLGHIVDGSHPPFDVATSCNASAKASKVNEVIIWFILIHPNKLHNMMLYFIWHFSSCSSHNFPCFSIQTAHLSASRNIVSCYQPLNTRQMDMLNKSNGFLYWIMRNVVPAAVLTGGDSGARWSSNC